MKKYWSVFGVNCTGMKPVVQYDSIPYRGLADQDYVQSRLGMTQFPIFAGFEPTTTLGTLEFFVEHVVRANYPNFISTVMQNAS